MTDTAHRKFVMTPLAAAVIASLSPTGNVIAQDEQDDDSEFALDEILVTATKRTLNLQDIPHSIDVVSSVQLERMRARDLEATLRALPSVGLVALQPGQNSLVVRGITTEPFEYRTDAQVAVYLDEQPMSSNSQQVGFRGIDMARVENLPGPQGTLFGASSQTGTIRYITNKPDFDGFSGEVEASVGTTLGGEGSTDFSVILNVPLFDDKLAARVVAYKSHDGGYVDNVFGTSLSGNYDNADRVEDNFNEYDVEGGRLHVDWNISDRWSALFSVVAENTAAEGVWDSDSGLGDYEVTRFEDEFRDDDWTSTSLTLSGDIGFADLTMTYTRFERDIVYEYDNMTYIQAQDAYYNPATGYYPFALYFRDYYRSSIFNDQQQERDAIELRLVSSGDSKFQWMAGAYYEDFLNEWFYGSRIPGLENTTAFSTANSLAYYYGVNSNYYNAYTPNTNQAYPLAITDISYANTFSNTVKQTAFFGEASYDITENLRLYGGFRWAEFDRNKFEKYTVSGGLIPAGDLATGGDGTFTDIGSESDSIFKFGMQYNLSDDKMVYALKSQGFRVGGRNSPRAVGTGLIPAAYKGDFLDNYEVGFKSQWAGGRLTMNASAFYMEWKDYLQGADFGDNAAWWLKGTVNAGGAETTGIEIQTQWQATERLSLSANLFFADAKFQDDFCNNFAGETKLPCDTLPGGGIDPDDLDIRAGQALPNSPDSKHYVSAYYEIPEVWGGNLWFYYDFSYTSETYNGSGEARDLDVQGLSPSRNYSNFSVGMQLPNELDITVAVNNVTNENSFSYIFTGEADDAAFFGDSRYQQQRAQDRPRTTWLTIRKGFGGE